MAFFRSSSWRFCSACSSAISTRVCGVHSHVSSSSPPLLSDFPPAAAAAFSSRDFSANCLSSAAPHVTQQNPQAAATTKGKGREGVQVRWGGGGAQHQNHPAHHNTSTQAHTLSQRWQCLGCQNTLRSGYCFPINRRDLRGSCNDIPATSSFQEISQTQGRQTNVSASLPRMHPPTPGHARAVSLPCGAWVAHEKQLSQCVQLGEV